MVGHQLHASSPIVITSDAASPKPGDWRQWRLTGGTNSAQTILSNLNYNQAVTAYQNDTSGFPAALLKGLFGIKEVEPFA